MSETEDKLARAAAEFLNKNYKFNPAICTFEPWQMIDALTKFGRELTEQRGGFECKARKAGTAGGNDPQDCDWPFCGCDEKAGKVIESLLECGWNPPRKMESWPQICHLCDKEMASPEDRTLWHGLGNCVPFCSSCSGSGIEEPVASSRLAQQQEGGGDVSGEDVSNAYWQTFGNNFTWENMAEVLTKMGYGKVAASSRLAQQLQAEQRTQGGTPLTPFGEQRVDDYRAGYSCGYSDAKNGTRMRDKDAACLFFGLYGVPDVFADEQVAQGANANASSRLVEVTAQLEPWKPEDGDTKCQQCFAPNPLWFAPNEVWNNVIPEISGVLCPNCFLARAKIDGAWKLVPEDAEDQAQAHEVNRVRVENVTLRAELERLRGPVKGMSDSNYETGQTLWREWFEGGGRKPPEIPADTSLMLTWIVAKFRAKLHVENATLRTEVERLQKWVNDLHSGMYVNCVYCGHRYGPDKDTPVAMADVLKQHIEKCPKHPLAEARAEVERLTKQLEQH